MFSQASFDSNLEKALALRAAWARAGVDFFQFLVEWEVDENSWRGMQGARTGYETFSKVLHSTNLTKSHRLDEFKMLVARFGLEQVRIIGLEAAQELNKIPDNVPSRREPETPAAEAAMRELCTFPARNHTTPSTMTARSAVRQHYEPPPKERKEEPSYDDRVKQLEHENAQLKRALLAKDREIAKLQKELAAAEARAIPPMAKSAVRRERSGAAKTTGGARRSQNNNAVA